MGLQSCKKGPGRHHRQGEGWGRWGNIRRALKGGQGLGVGLAALDKADRKKHRKAVALKKKKHNLTPAKPPKKE